MHNTKKACFDFNCSQRLTHGRSCTNFIHRRLIATRGSASPWDFRDQEQARSRRRRACCIQAVAAADPTSEEEEFSDGLNGFIPTWAKGAVDVKPIPEVGSSLFFSTFKVLGCDPVHVVIITSVSAHEMIHGSRFLLSLCRDSYFFMFP